ncbi:unnamed protein product, partial [Prorocentrum cordatum]
PRLARRRRPRGLPRRPARGQPRARGGAAARALGAAGAGQGALAPARPRRASGPGLRPRVRRPGERSSNAYATGSNQNVGNVVTDRRTTYVAQPPGGRSQISFG